jgi:pentatricopeptide repeat protein
MTFSYRDEMVTEGIRPTVSTYNMLIHALFLDGKMNEADGIYYKRYERLGVGS